VFAGVRFAVGRVQEESSVPQPRLSYIHLQNSSVVDMLLEKSNSAYSVRQRNPTRLA